jgi:hypothetical protein
MHRREAFIMTTDRDRCTVTPALEKAAVSLRALPPKDDAVVMALVLTIWLLGVTVFLISWSILHVRARRGAGINESLYIDGKDEASLADAAREAA